MKSTIKFVHALIILVVFLSACNKSTVNKDIVLKIGKLEVTDYEYNRYYAPQIIDSTTNLVEIKDEYINKCYIIADAYDKKYDTISSIKKRLKHTSDFMMIQKYGYLWQKIVSPIVDEYKEVTEEKINKREKLYYFEYIAASNLDSLLIITHGDSILNDNNKFKDLKSVAHRYNFLSSDYFSTQWPFGSFWKHKDVLMKMKLGEISKLLLVDNQYYFLYLDHIEDIKISEEDKGKLLSELQNIKETEIDENTTKEIQLACKPEINNKAVNELSNWMVNGNALKDYPKNLSLMKYILNDTLRDMYLNDFVEYYSNIPYPFNITNKEKLLFEMGQYLDNQYLFLKAQKLGLYEMDSLLLGEQNYRNTLMFNEYVNSEIVSKIIVDSNEVVEFYNRNKEYFYTPETFVINLYVFDKKINTIWSYETVRNLVEINQIEKIADPKVIKGLVELKDNYELNYKDLNNLSESYKEVLLNTRKGEIGFNPVQVNNNWAILHKITEKGKVIKPLEEVYDIISDIILNKKADEQHKILIERLKEKHPIEIDKIEV